MVSVVLHRNKWDDRFQIWTKMHEWNEALDDIVRQIQSKERLEILMITELRFANIQI